VSKSLKLLIKLSQRGATSATDNSIIAALPAST
jgi:hypothetical protein